jgi:hypothetical protein
MVAAASAGAGAAAAAVTDALTAEVETVAPGSLPPAPQAVSKASTPHGTAALFIREISLQTISMTVSEVLFYCSEKREAPAVAGATAGMRHL